jgi:hypothetical protein
MIRLLAQNQVSRQCRIVTSAVTCGHASMASLYHLDSMELHYKVQLNLCMLSLLHSAKQARGMQDMQLSFADVTSS